jgi:hypothetical protein
MKREILSKKSLNPVQKKGERNFFCPFYRDCLDYAVTESWRSWGCLECKHKMKEDHNDHVFTRDFIPSYEIPAGLRID